MTTVVYGYKNCDTCRKAWRWLDDHGVPYQPAEITVDPPDRHTLETAWRASDLPLKRFFNTAGRSYRIGGWSQRIKEGATEAEQLDALAADPMLIKRPLLIGEGVVLVGFKPEAYRSLT